MKKRNAKLLVLSVLSFVASCALTSMSVAWFKDGANISFGDDDNIYLKAGTEKGLYASGSGTSSDPYLITSRTHLYNLAWAQYVGRYNESNEETNIQHLFFKLGNNIDMTGLTLPPIGTEAYPFFSDFNGGDYTISNLTVCNDDPRSDTSAFGSAKPNADDIPSGATQPRVVGFFGAIGAIPTSGLSASDYSGITGSLHNVTLNNLTVNSKTSETLIGLAAGYVDGDMSSVKVGKSTISINDSAPITSITDNLSDYSLVGYSSSTATASEFTKSISNRVAKTVSGGQEGGFGDSVNFKDYTSWLYSLHENKQYDTGTESYDVGYMVDSSASSTYSRRYNIKTGTYYSLRHRTNNPAQISDPSYLYSITARTPSNESSYYNYSFNFKSDYSGIYNEFISSSSSVYYTQAFTWSVSGSGTEQRYTLTFSSSVTRYSSNNFDLKCTGTSSGSPSHFKPCTKGGSTVLLDLTFYFSDYHIYHFTNGNYIPLQFNEDYTSASNKNTGYIVGTSLVSDTDYVGSASPRISSYSSSYLSGSVTNDKIASVKTYDNGEWKTITETKDEDGYVTGTENVSFLSGKYAKARNAVATAIEGQDTIHGIHFDVSGSNKYADGYYRGSIYEGAYIEETMLLKSYNGTAKTTRMPKGCIDFELEDSGYITFFAGMYNMSSISSLNYFSLFKVNRSSPTSYTLSEIKKVYKSTTWSLQNPTYVYWFDGEAEPSQKGDLVFDIETTLWPARSKDNSLYYFEIPVNQGEYVMGAVNQSHTGDTAYQGAYMMYLDIGSNGKQKGDNEMVGYSITTQNNGSRFPNGVDFNITDLGAVGGETIALAITFSDTNVDGDIVFTVGSTVDINASIATKYVYTNITPSSSGEITPTAGGLGSGSGYRLIRAVIDDSDGANWQIEVKQTLDDNGDVTGSLEKVIITCDGDDKDLSELPEIFTDNIALFYQYVAVNIGFKGADFSMTVNYSGTNYSIVNITIPTNELGSTPLTVTTTTGYSCVIINSDNDQIYPTS